MVFSVMLSLFIFVDWGCKLDRFCAVFHIRWTPSREVFSRGFCVKIPRLAARNGFFAVLRASRSVLLRTE